MGDTRILRTLVLTAIASVLGAVPASARPERAIVEQTVNTVANAARQATATAGGLLGARTTPAPPAPETPAEATEREFLTLANAERARRGLGTLAPSDALRSVARRQSVRMQTAGALWHNNPGLLHEVSGWSALGENVGRGPSVRDIHDAFMASPSHRANILDGGFTLVGIGAVVQPDKYIFVTVDFEEPARPAPEPVAPAQTVDVLERLLALDAPD